MHKLTNIFLILILAFSSNAIYAANDQSTKNTQTKSAELKQLNDQIAQLQKTIQQDQGHKTELSQQYQKNLAQLVVLQKRVIELNRELSKKQAALTTLQKNQISNQQHLTEQNQLLAEQAHAAYFLMRNELYTPQQINQDAQQRYLAYFHNLIPARIDVINQHKQTASELQSKQHQVVKQKVALQTTLTQQQKTQQQLDAAKKNQQKALSQLSTQLQTKSETLKKLIANRRALEQLIKSLEKAEKARQQQRRLPTGWQPLPSGAPFTQVQGKLSWPTAGNLATHFGSSIDQSELKYNGVLISAPTGQSVRAIYQGRVVFANLLQGLGLLIIIDHGNGYLSLYGHNQTLYKKVGDVVKAGDMIATTGNSNGQGPSGVYFEIRHNSQPLNPERWCRR